MASRWSALALCVSLTLAYVPAGAVARSCLEPKDTVVVLCKQAVCEPGFVVQGELTSTCDVLPRIVDGERRHFDKVRELMGPASQDKFARNGVYTIEAKASCFYPSATPSNCKWATTSWVSHYPTADALAEVRATWVERARKRRREYRSVLFVAHAVHGLIGLGLSIGPFALVLFASRRRWMHVWILPTIFVFLGITLAQIAGAAFLGYRVVEYTGFGARELVSLIGMLLILISVPAQFVLLIILRGGPPPDPSTAGG